jgi:2-keto-4-pentenoate hydratase
MDLSRLTADQGKIVPAGSWVLLGAATAAVTLHSGMRVKFALECPGGSSQRMELQAL